MLKLLVILCIVKLYAGINIYKCFLDGSLTLEVKVLDVNGIRVVLACLLFLVSMPWSIIDISCRVLRMLF